MSAARACEVMAEAIQTVVPQVEIVQIPMADGGEGTVESLVLSTGGEFVDVEVVGPLGSAITSRYGILGDEKTAVIEMAAASGLPLVPLQQRNPLVTTTYGTGQLIADAMDRGCSRLVVGIGGSATTDCGTGMAQALGAVFYTKQDKPIQEVMNGERMAKVKRIDLSGLHPGLFECEIVAACDVDNPLLGTHGAVRVYSKQKGASEAQLDILEENMTVVIDVIEQTIGQTIRNIPGSGAAGGLGAGLLAFTQAHLTPGIKMVLDACHFTERIRGADLILTGEGRLDKQTIFGKTISGILREAKQQGIPVIAFAGDIETEAESLYAKGLTSMFSITTGPMSVAHAFGHAEDLLRTAVERVLYLWTAKGSS